MNNVHIKEYSSSNLDPSIFYKKEVESKIFALIDCNNFYVSCERLFRPDLNNKPIIVLSNNDGCIVSRSNEVKSLGVPMGAPLFKYKNIIKNNNVNVFSSNYKLYSDISCRVMNSLRLFCPDIEIYSIDEAFLRLDKMSICNINNFVNNLYNKVSKWTGIPISIGLAPTKTLSKIANNIAKTRSEFLGVCNLSDIKNIDSTFKSMKVSEIWGVAKKTEAKLNSINIFTIYDFKNSNQKLIRKVLGVVGERIFLELNGVSCLDIQEVSARKHISYSRSFSEKQTKFEEISQAIANYTNCACAKLRRQKTVAKGIIVYIATSPYSQKENYSNSYSIALDNPSSNSVEFIKKAQECLKRIFRHGYSYHKSGIVLFDISEESILQESFLENKIDDERNKNLMKIIDDCNNKSKSQILFFASQGVQRKWQTKKDLCSPCYTRWEELATVK